MKKIILLLTLGLHLVGYGALKQNVLEGTKRILSENGSPKITGYASEKIYDFLLKKNFKDNGLNNNFGIYGLTNGEIDYILKYPEGKSIDRLYEFEVKDTKSMGYQVIEKGDNYILTQMDFPSYSYRVLLYKTDTLVIEIEGVPSKKLDQYLNLFTGWKK